MTSELLAAALVALGLFVLILTAVLLDVLTRKDQS